MNYSPLPDCKAVPACYRGRCNNRTKAALQWRPNRRLQLTAFGARDRWHFDTFRGALAAAEARTVGLCQVDLIDGDIHQRAEAKVRQGRK
jgi:hypothetical protein